ncbi:MAG: arginine deiminase-related protein [Cyclobacteriaceae bacterium]|nr:amidinotransferase [Cyclobacteriaceae bacterium]MCB0500677.1 amidinotransferase [Cyclobacteriaceae bacterium]MCB9236550.1 amidinotransferase [Flammeovirgaceae bacterium]MCO5273017.1 arginine deiminase-related protein [Cyclobacteriaceae bacterium]MCW5903215.1 amidinotransferase [Cyclobacteriaceae bacterium]
MVFSQVPHTILMVRPASFGYNPETAASNAFQVKSADEGIVQGKALEEFDRAVDTLIAHGVCVRVIEDTPQPVTTDAIFPNNWITLHEDGRIILYPMMAPSRRLERRQDLVRQLSEEYKVTEVVDLSGAEQEGKFLEGTGSIVFDHPHKIAYACRSERTNEGLFVSLCRRLGYKPIVFHAVDESGRAIYHTNVMMWVGESVAGVCLDAIHSDADQELVLGQLALTGKKVIALGYGQMNSFAGNMFEVRNADNERFLLMSGTAYHSLLPGQLQEIGKHLVPLPLDIPTIEGSGGGSIRCMVAGIHLPVK